MSYAIHARRISHERLGDEVIIINLVTGAYYAGSGTAADVWTLLVQGASIDQAAEKLALEYSGNFPTIRDDVEVCVTALLKAGILDQADAAAAPPSALELPIIASREWKPPAFDEYTDMWDLIQLDPIHDVDDTGWPHALPKSKL
jgi:hypothetical protein